MTATQTQTAETGTELAALSSAGRPFPAEPSTHNTIGTSNGSFDRRASVTDLYDLENAEFGTAAIRNIPPHATPDRRRLRLLDIKSNKIPRQRLTAMIILGVVGLIYEYTSLGPQFWGAHTTARGLEVQMQVGADARQSMAYAFLAECVNRKV